MGEIGLISGALDLGYKGYEVAAEAAGWITFVSSIINQSGMPRGRSLSKRGTRSASSSRSRGRTPPRSTKKSRTSKSRSVSKRRRARKPARDRKAISGVPIVGSTIHSGVGTMSLYCNLSKKRRPIKSLGNWVFHESYTTVCSSPAGKTSLDPILTFLSKPQLTVGNNTIGTGDKSKATRSLFSMNPYANITGSNDQSGALPFWNAGGINVNQDKIHLKHISFQLDISNVTNVNVHMELHVYVCKKDDSANPYQKSNALLAQENCPGTLFSVAPKFYTAAQLAGAGVVYNDAGTGNISVPQNNMVGVPLGSANGFNKYWKSCTMQKFDLAAASTHKMSGKIVLDKILDKQWVNNNVNDNIKDYTIVVVARNYGQVVIDTTGGANIPTYSSTDVAICAQVAYHLSAVKNNAARLNLETASYFIPTGAADVALGHIGAGDTAIQTVGF